MIDSPLHALAHRLEQAVTAGRTVGVEIDDLRQRLGALAGRDHRGHGVRIRLHHRILADHGHGRTIAATNTGHPLHAHPGAEPALQRLRKRHTAVHRTGQRIAHPHRQRRRWRLALTDDIEVVIEGRDLEHLGARQLHRFGQRGEMVGEQRAVRVLQAVQVFDQTVAARDLAANRGAGRGKRGVGQGRTRRSARAFLGGHG